MIKQLRELAVAEPFAAFTICIRGGEEFSILERKNIGFTDFGNPQIRVGDRLYILNVDAITAIKV
jgi:hypothetical protein